MYRVVLAKDLINDVGQYIAVYLKENIVPVKILSVNTAENIIGCEFLCGTHKGEKITTHYLPETNVNVYDEENLVSLLLKN